MNALHVGYGLVALAVWAALGYRLVQPFCWAASTVGADENRTVTGAPSTVE